MATKSHKPDDHRDAGKDSSGGAAAAARLGLMAPLTGLVELYGPEISRAGRIACDEINERGGVLGRPLELVIADDGSLPETAVPAAEELVDEMGCTAIIGNLLSNSRIAVANRVADRKRVPYLNFSFYEGSILSRYFFHFAALPNQQIDKMIPYMAERYGPKFYFAGSNYEWPRGSIDAAKRALVRYDGEIIGERYLPIGTQKVDKLLDSVARSGANVFVPYFAGADQTNLLTRFTEKGLKNHMAVVMGHYDEAMASTLTPEVREGFYSSNTYFMSVDTPENRAYQERMSRLPEVTGIWPDGNGILTNFGEGTYLCVHAFACAAELAGTLDTKSLIEALRCVRVVGPQGVVNMDPQTQHATVNSYLARCRADGTFEIIKSFGCIEPVIPKRYQHALADMERVVAEAVQSPDFGAGSEDRPRKGESKVVPLKPEAEEVARVSSAEAVLKKADIAIISVDESGAITRANNRACVQFGYPHEEMVGLSVHLLVPPHLRTAHKQHLNRFVEGDTLALNMDERGEVLGYCKDGSQFPVEASVAKFRENGKWITVVTLLDITQRKEDQENLIWRATHDPPTELPNRALIQDRLGNALYRSQRSGDKVALLFVDLDGFKLINDTYGHDIGDKFLIATSERLVELVRPGDTVARLGGDEFIILCENIEDENTIAGFCERIVKSLREPLQFDGEEFFATASVGLAIGSGKTHLSEDLLRNADAAMYLAKERGHDSWRIYDDEIHVKSKFQLTIANGLRTAIGNNEFQVNFQPIIDLNMRSIVGAEALLRWFPSGNSFPPDEFIPVAERTGSIKPIGAWVYEQACQAMSVLQNSNGSTTLSYISVNLSTVQLSDPDLVETFKEILGKTGVDPQRILLEITETSIMRDTESNIKTLNELGNLGHKIAVDDFGTGYSSLAQLMRMPVNTLKIDKAFIDPLDSKETTYVLVAAIIKMARALGLNVIAEGVEDQNQMDILGEMGCNCIQGYLFSRPVEFEELVNQITKQNEAMAE